MNTAELERARLAAEHAADAAASVIADYVASGDWQVRFKADDTPVTEVDVAAETAIHAVLEQATPMIGFLGEETGVHAARQGVSPGHEPGDGGANRGGSDGTESARSRRWQWLVDPIDGTKSFVRGSRYYSTQIALWDGHRAIVGVSNAPAYGERLVAVHGQGVWLNGQPVCCRATTRIEQAFLSSGNLGTLAGDAAAWTRYGQLVSRVRRVRGYGDFAHYHQLCIGQADLVIESDLNILDVAALSVAVLEAGGHISDLQGRPLGLASTSVLAASTRELHARALAMMHG